MPYYCVFKVLTLTAVCVCVTVIIALTLTALQHELLTIIPVPKYFPHISPAVSTKEVPQLPADGFSLVAAAGRCRRSLPPLVAGL